MKQAARRLKLIMAKQGRSPYWLAKQLGRDLSSLQKTINGERRMTVDFVERACMAMNARPAWVAFNEGDMYEPVDPLKLCHPLDLALAYDRGRFAPDAVSAVKAYRNAHPNERWSPRQWTAMLKARQAQLLADDDHEIEQK